MGIPGAVGSVGAPFVPGQNYRVDKMAETGLYDAGKRGERRPGDPHLRIKEMEKDGVDAEIIFGILGVASRVQDHEAANEMLRIYNDWLKDFCSHYPDRQIGLACLPYGDIDAAVEGDPPRRQARPPGPRTVVLVGHGADVAPGAGSRCGRRSATCNCRCISTPSRRPRAACASRPRQSSRRAAQFTGVAGFQMNLINIIAAIIGAGVLERYPNLRVGFGESGIGWIPYALDRMDFEFEDRFRDLMKMKPERILAPPVPRDLPVRPHRRRS